MNKYEWLFGTQQALMRRVDVLGGGYAITFLKEIDAAIKRAYEAAEAKRKADNAKRT